MPIFVGMTMSCDRRVREAAAGWGCTALAPSMFAASGHGGSIGIVVEARAAKGH
jgi:hypothetical protein